MKDKLFNMKRLQMFKRISHRAGLASFNTRKLISDTHKATISGIYNAILTHFPGVTEEDLKLHLKNCQGVKFSNFTSVTSNPNPQSGESASTANQVKSRANSQNRSKTA